MFPPLQVQTLRNYGVFHTSDPSEFRHALVSGLRARRVDVDHGGELRASGRIAPLGAIELSHYECNQRVSIEFEETTSFWFVHHGQSGQLEIRTDETVLPINEGNSCIIPAGTRSQLEGQGEIFVLRITPRAAARRLAATPGAQFVPNRGLPASFRNDQNCVRLLLGLMSLLNLELDRTCPNPAVVDGLEHAILVAFARLIGATTSVKSHQDAVLARAQLAADHINANLDRAVTMGELAAVAKVSQRTLVRAFQTVYGCSPMAYSKSQRLVRAREMLADPDAGMGVTSVALRFGFQNIGRFSWDYREMFGELPSRTATKAKGGV